MISHHLCNMLEDELAELKLDAAPRTCISTSTLLFMETYCPSWLCHLLSSHRKSSHTCYCLSLYSSLKRKVGVHRPNFNIVGKSNTHLQEGAVCTQYPGDDEVYYCQRDAMHQGFYAYLGGQYLTVDRMRQPSWIWEHVFEDMINACLLESGHLDASSKTCKIVLQETM